MNYVLQEVDMSAINTVSQLIRYAKDEIDAGKTMNNPQYYGKAYSYSSAASAASKLIAIFPLLVSKTVSSSSAQMVAKYIEQEGCVILQMALQQANISNAKSGIEYLSTFHKNLNIGGDGIDAVAKTLNLWVDSVSDSDTRNNNYRSDYNRAHYESTDLSELYESDNSIKISATQMNDLLKLFEEAENIKVYDTKMNPISLNEYRVNETGNGDYRVSIKSIKGLNEYKIAEDKETGYQRKVGDNYSPTENEDVFDAPTLSGNRSIDDLIYSHNERTRQANRKNDRDDRTNASEKQFRIDRYNQERKDRQEDELERERRKHEYDAKVRSQDWERENKRLNVGILKDQDIKKMNNAVPSLLIVRFYSSTDARVATEFIIGVKSKVVGCNSDEILRRVANDNKDGKSFLNLMRTITGELKVSDFLFGLSRISDDLQSTRKKGSNGDTWALLQSRALAAKEALRKHRVNDYSAITTVVVSRADVDSLYREENIDLSNPSVAMHFMKSYNLLGVAIVDDALESLKIIFDDGNKYFEELSYQMLEKETPENNTYKKLINLMASSR